MVDEETVRRLALGLPGATERPTYGSAPSWRTAPRMFAWIREDPYALVVWVSSLEERQLLIETDPEVFFTTPHYRNDPIVLVNLDAIDEQQAAEVLTESWRLRAPRSLTKDYTSD